MKIQFNVSNEGLGEPFRYWWRDRVVSNGPKSNFICECTENSHFVFHRLLGGE